MFRDSVVYACARGIPAAINFLALAIFTRILSPQEYGDYALILATVGLLNAGLFWWLRLSVTRFLPSYSSSGDRDTFFAVVQRSYLVLIGLCAFISIALFCLYYDTSFRYLLLSAGVLLVALGLYELVLEILRAELRPFMYGAVSVTRSVLATTLGASLAYLGWGALGLLLGAITALLIPVAAIVRQFPFQAQAPRARRRKLQRQLLTYGLPLAFAYTLNGLLAKGDIMILTWLLGTQAAGEYAAAYDLTWPTLGVALNVIYLSSFPRIVLMLREQDKDRVNRQLAQCAGMLVAVGLPASVGFYLVAPSLVEVVLGGSYRTPALMLIPWIAVAAFLGGLKAYYFDLSFQLARKTSLQSIIIMAAAAINIGLNLVLIPKLGTLGAAYATVTSYTIALALSVYYASKSFTLPIPWRAIVEIVFATLAMAFAVRLVSLAQSPAKLLVCQVVVGGVVFTTTVMLFNTMNIRTMLADRTRAFLPFK